MTILEQMLEGTKFITILGHIRPDGDCLGSALGLYNYLWLNRPDIRTAAYLEEPSPKFNHLRGYDKTHHQADDMYYGLRVCLNSGDIQRLDDFRHYLDRADESLRLDHHATNIHYGGTNAVSDEASSTCEVLLDQLDKEEIDHYMTECLCTSIVYDTDVLKFSCTSTHTMEITGKLMEKRIDFGAIIGNSFYGKTYIQNRILGRVPLGSITFFDGRCISGAIHQSEMGFYGVDGKGLDGIIDQSCLTEGVEVVIFIYETSAQEFEVSMHSRYLADVGRITVFFEGRGHVRVAGCTTSDGIHDVTNNLSVHIAGQLDAVPNGQE